MFIELTYGKERTKVLYNTDCITEIHSRSKGVCDIYLNYLDEHGELAATTVNESYETIKKLLSF